MGEPAGGKGEFTRCGYREGVQPLESQVWRELECVEQEDGNRVSVEDIEGAKEIDWHVRGTGGRGSVNLWGGRL